MATNGDQIVTIGGRPLYPIIDDDDMSEASAYNVPSSESVKAYVDTKTGTLSVAELAALDGVTAGSVTASKALIVDNNKHLNEVNTTTLSIGASGSAVAITATAAEINALDRVGAVGVAEASKAVILDTNKHLNEVNTAKLSIGATGAEVQITATPAHINLYTARVNSLIDYLSDGLLISSGLEISATPEKFKTIATSAYTIGGLCYTKAATDNLTFTAADTINTDAVAGDYFGVWLVQINATGTVSTKSPAEDQVYTSSELAIEALPTADTDNIAIGYIVIGANNGASWTANTGDMAPGSDCASATFVDATLKTLPAKLA